MGKKGGSRLSKGGSPSKSDLNPHRVKKMELYRTLNKRYHNKVRKAEKRYKSCPKILKYVKEHIIIHRKNYTKGRG